jgi:hypothetical protein
MEGQHNWLVDYCTVDGSQRAREAVSLNSDSQWHRTANFR